jgi:hypothetical protein
MTVNYALTPNKKGHSLPGGLLREHACWNDLSDNPILSILRLNLRQVRTDIKQVLSPKLLFHEFREMRGKWKAQAHAVSLLFVPSGLCGMGGLDDLKRFLVSHFCHDDFLLKLCRHE